MKIQTIKWQNDCIKIIDQTKLPLKLEYIYLKDIKSLWKAIRRLEIRGAPALGAAAGLGLYLGIRDVKAKSFPEFVKEVDKVSRFLASSRPTARNLFWALERVNSVILKNKEKNLSEIKKLMLRAALTIIEEDRLACRKIGFCGAELIKDNDTILTICNAGILATIDYGTALGVIYQAQRLGKTIKVFSCETRPLLQGSRLTTWELKKNKIDVTLICDSMAATLMQQARIDKVISGADRIASNGDSANKIGTYNLAVLSHYHKIPFYIAAPESTFDLAIKSGKEIVIEQRDKREITELFFRSPVAAKGIKVYNPAFDVTPAKLITAIITDKGIIRPPYKVNIKKICQMYL